MDIAYTCSFPLPHLGPKHAVLPSHHRALRLSQLLMSTHNHHLPKMLLHFPPSFHLNVFLMHCYTRNAFGKSFRKVLLGPPSIKLYYSFSASFYPANMQGQPLTQAEQIGVGIFVFSESISTGFKSNLLGATVVNNKNSVTYGSTFHSLTALHKEIFLS